MRPLLDALTAPLARPGGQKGAEGLAPARGLLGDVQHEHLALDGVLDRGQGALGGGGVGLPQGEQLGAPVVEGIGGVTAEAGQGEQQEGRHAARVAPGP